MYTRIAELAENSRQQVVSCRRDLHQHAESGWLEMRTSSLVARRLTELGYCVLTGKAVCKAEDRMGLPPQAQLDEHFLWACENGAVPEFIQHSKGGFTGVIGVLDCGPGPVVALRFDMDALSVSEAKDSEHLPKREGFSSVTNVMHACGHDGHTAIGLGVAELIMQISSHLSGTVKLIFQPAEEGVRGAKAIVGNGHLDDVDYVIAAHMMNSADESPYVSPGMAGTFATSKLDAQFEGHSAHAGAAPHMGKNALLAAATALLNLYAIPRHGEGATTVNVGGIHADNSRNVVCDRATMELEVRGETSGINEYMDSYAQRILETAAAMHNCTVKVKRMGGAAAIECTPALTQRVETVCRKLRLEVRAPEPMGGSEDFSYMTQRVIERGGQSCFIGLNVPCAAPFHNTRFDFDEAALLLGVKVFAGSVYDLLGNN